MERQQPDKLSPETDLWRVFLIAGMTWLLPLGPGPAQATRVSPSPAKPVTGGKRLVIPVVALQHEEMEQHMANGCG